MQMFANDGGFNSQFSDHILSRIHGLASLKETILHFMGNTQLSKANHQEPRPSVQKKVTALGVPTD